MAFRIALSGLTAANVDLSVTANNVANSNTFGFKASSAEFADVFASGTLDFRTAQVGNGVRLASVAQQFTQGNVEFTDNSLDLAISGEGFFTLRDPGGFAYTRNGTFSVNREGFVVNSHQQFLQVYPPLAGGGFNTGTLSDLRLQASQGQPNATTRADIVLNLPANAQPPAVGTFDPTVPASYTHTTSTAVYDSLGNMLTASMYFIKGANPNEWSVALTLEGQPVGPPQPLVFSSTGTLTTPASGDLSWNGIASTLGADALNLNFNFANSTQYGREFGVGSLVQDGYATGRLSSVDVSDSGIVSARFTNGRSVELGQLALSNFPNPQGLRQLGNTTWGETFNSGNVIRGQATTGSLGSIQSGAIEGSNVDLTEELVNMITAQRAFQANAQMITTSDQITQTILNIR